MNKLFPFLLLLFIGACTSPKSEWQLKKDEALRSNITADSLFLGFHFGMSRDSFINYCRSMNQQGILSNEDGILVTYKLPTQLGASAKMYFYPDFNENGIYEMPVYMRYEGWAPWNKALSADSLYVQLEGLLNDWYGPGTFTVPHPKGYPALVRFDGNRQIKTWKEPTTGKVHLLMTDMNANPE